MYFRLLSQHQNVSYRLFLVFNFNSTYGNFQIRFTVLIFKFDFRLLRMVIEYSLVSNFENFADQNISIVDLIYF